MKKMKIFYMGKRLKDVYPHATRFQVIKYRVMVFIRKVLIGSLGVSALIGSAMIGAYFPATTILAVQQVKINTLPEKLDDLKDDVVSRLATCESAGAKEPDALITYDPDRSGKKERIASLGSLQFKVATVQHYISKFEGRTISQIEAIKIATDSKKASELAKKIIFSDDSGLSNWVNCSKKLNLEPEVSVINKLSQ